MAGVVSRSAASVELGVYVIVGAIAVTCSACTARTIGAIEAIYYRSTIALTHGNMFSILQCLSLSDVACSASFRVGAVLIPSRVTQVRMPRKSWKSINQAGPSACPHEQWGVMHVSTVHAASGSDSGSSSLAPGTSYVQQAEVFSPRSELNL